MSDRSLRVGFENWEAPATPAPPVPAANVAPRWDWALAIVISALAAAVCAGRAMGLLP
ncbi:MAG: hypothetical protein WCE44_02750 [Candidatus Velthaea sp.]